MWLTDHFWLLTTSNGDDDKKFVLKEIKLSLIIKTHEYFQLLDISQSKFISVKFLNYENQF